MSYSLRYDLLINRTSDEHWSPYPSSIHWWIGLLELLVFLFGVPLNLMVFYLICSNRRKIVISQLHKRRITEMFVISMTSADLLFCAVHAPLMFLNFNQEVGLDPVPCLTMFAVTHTSTVASSLSLLWLNVNKFMQLHRPLHHFLYVTRSRSISCVMISWAASITLGLLFVLGPFISYDAQCNIYLRHKSVYVVFALVFFILPAIVSLAISIYVTVVVVEMKTGNSRKYNPFCHSRRLNSGDGKNNHPPVDLMDSMRLLTMSAPADKDNEHRNFWVHVNIQNSVREKKRIQSKSLSPPPGACYRIHHRRRAFSPTQWPPPGGFRQLSPSARRVAHIRRISFVFATTIWSTLTVLGYRVAFIVNTLPKPEVNQFSNQTGSGDIANLAYFCLFAIMTLNAVGNPLITMLTQRHYSACLREMWRKVCGKKKSTKRTGAISGCDRRSPGQDDSGEMELER